MKARTALRLLGLVCGLGIVAGTTWIYPLRELGWQALGPLLGIVLTVCSLFGDLPLWIAWVQRLGTWVFSGVAVATILLLLPLLIPRPGHDTSLIAFSPAVWGAYLSIVLVGISFEASSLPMRIYHAFQAQRLGPQILVPAIVIVAGLLGNILDGVSIMAISVVIFLSILPRLWAVRASFALLFGGLISNLITVAAEPTNIKFQDALQSVLDRVSPSYWLTNWPISVLGILAPAIWLGWWMSREHVSWRSDEPEGSLVFQRPRVRRRLDAIMSLSAIILLAGGIILHTALQAERLTLGQMGEPVPLWLVLLPGGLAAALHLVITNNASAPAKTIAHEWPVWGKLMIIFSLLWFVANGLTQSANVLASFFTLAAPLRYGMMVVLSLASSITDNVALAAMQASLLIHQPGTVWQIRLLFILLTWSGGFTPFGCLQSLTVNSRLHFTTAAWIRETWIWGALSLAGGLIGLFAIGILYPTAVGPVR